MKVAFLILRSNHFRTIASIIEAATENPEINPEIILFNLDYSKKGGQTPTKANMPERLKNKCSVKIFTNIEEFLNYSEKFDALITLNRVWELLRGDSKPVNPAWCTVFDTLDQCLPHYKMENTWHPKSYSEFSDLYLLPTEFYREVATHWNLSPENIMKERTRFVGYVRSDQFSMISGKDIHDKYGMPNESPIVLFIPDHNKLRKAKSINSTRWYSDLWLADNIVQRLFRAVFFHRNLWSIKQALSPEVGYERALRKISLFCKRNGAKLVIAPRRKKDWRDEECFSDQEKEIADHLIIESEDYPQTLLKLIKASDLVITTCFTQSVLDCAAAGIPFVSLKLPPHAVRSDFLKDYFKFHSMRTHFPGVSWEIPAKEFISDFDKYSLDDFKIDPEKQKQYFEKFVGVVDGKCSKRVLEEIKKHVESRTRENKVSA